MTAHKGDIGKRVIVSFLYLHISILAISTFQPFYPSTPLRMTSTPFFGLAQDGIARLPVIPSKEGICVWLYSLPSNAQILNQVENDALRTPSASFRMTEHLLL